MPEKSKPPLRARRVYADELTVIEDGVTYYPHVGEWVEFRGRPSLGLYLEIQKLNESPDALDHLFSFISAWTLTDDHGEPYPLEVASLMRMPQVELSWLLSMVDSPGTEAASKNESGDSI